MARLTDIAHWRPLGPGNPPTKMDRHDIICLHTMVGYLTSTDAMFKEHGYTGVESHFGVGGAWGSDRAGDLDGVIYQWVDTEYRADANLDGNHRILSIETADNAPAKASGILPWTPAQCQAIIRLVADLCQRYDIPAVLVPDSRSTRRGIAYHRQGIDPWRVAGGETWSASRGKECPGDARIAQIKSTIIPGVVATLNPPKEDDMEPKDVWNGKGTDMIPHNEPGPSPRTPTDPDNPTWYPASTLEETNRVVRDLLARVKAQDDKLDEILAKFDTPATGK